MSVNEHCKLGGSSGWTRDSVLKKSVLVVAVDTWADTVRFVWGDRIKFPAHLVMLPRNLIH
jgi:hypothetical protein